jgi:hypothetical protein
MNSKDNIYTNDELIKKLYNNVTYFDEYGTSIIIFVGVTLIVISIVLYYTTKSKIGEIKDDWRNKRCHPLVIPFAGIINKPHNKSVIQFTEENFTFCVDNILNNISGNVLQPLDFLTNQLISVYQELGKDITAGRGMINYIRTNYSIFTREIMNKLLNSGIPVQLFINGIKNINLKIVDSLTKGLYSFLGEFETL